MQLPTSLCPKLRVSWATPRHSKVQRGVGTVKCSDQPKLAQSPTTPVAKSGLPKAFPKVTAWGVQSAEPLPVGPGPTMVYSTPCSKVRRYGNMKKSIKATVGILQQSVEIINTDIRCDGMHQLQSPDGMHQLQSPRILLMRLSKFQPLPRKSQRSAGSIHSHFVKVHSTCASSNACPKL